MPKSQTETWDRFQSLSNAQKRFNAALQREFPIGARVCFFDTPEPFQWWEGTVDCYSSPSGNVYLRDVEPEVGIAKFRILGKGIVEVFVGCVRPLSMKGVHPFRPTTE